MFEYYLKKFLNLVKVNLLALVTPITENMCAVVVNVNKCNLNTKLKPFLPRSTFCQINQSLLQI